MVKESNGVKSTLKHDFFSFLQLLGIQLHCFLMHMDLVFWLYNGQNRSDFCKLLLMGDLGLLAL